MHALTVALYRRLASDETLTRDLVPYRGGPAVFTSRLAPADAILPYVHVRPPASDVPWDTLNRPGREILQDIAVYADVTGSEALIEAIAERVRDLLHARPLDVEGWHCAMVIATGPADAPEEVGYSGRIVTARVRLQRA